MLHTFTVFLESSLFIYFSYLAGNLAFRFLKFENFSATKHVVYSILCGYGLYAFSGFLLALAGIFSGMALWIISVILILFSFQTIVDHIRKIKRCFVVPYAFLSAIKDGLRKHPVPKLIALVWFGANFLMVFVPITGYDTLDYHLPMMLDIIKEREFTYTPAIRQYPSLPVLGEVLHTVPMAMFGEATPEVYKIFDYNNTTEIKDRKLVMSELGSFTFQVIQYSIMALLALMLFDFVRTRLKNSFLAPISVLLLFSIFDLWREVLHGGYIDVFAFAFCLASIFLMIELCLEGNIRSRQFLLSAFFLGIALGIKYLSLFFAFANCLVLIMFFIRHRIGLKVAFRRILQYSLIVLLIAGFWYAKNLVNYGNPVHPMFSVDNFDSVVNEFIMEPTVWNFPLFPIYRYTGWFFSDKESSSRLIVLGFYVLSYTLGFFLLVARRKFPLVEKLLLVSIVSITALLFFSSHIYRFLLPSVILLIPLLVFFIDRFYELLEEKISIHKYNIFRKVSVASIYVALFLVFALGNFHFWKIRFDFVTGRIALTEYILRIGSL